MIREKEQIEGILNTIEQRQRTSIERGYVLNTNDKSVAFNVE